MNTVIEVRIPQKYQDTFWSDNRLPASAAGTACGELLEQRFERVRRPSRPDSISQSRESIKIVTRNIQVEIFWIVTQYSCGRIPALQRTLCLHLQGKVRSSADNRSSYLHIFNKRGEELQCREMQGINDHEGLLITITVSPVSKKKCINA
jgi:hypothetical protein